MSGSCKVKYCKHVQIGDEELKYKMMLYLYEMRYDRYLQMLGWAVIIIKYLSEENERAYSVFYSVPRH